MIEDIWVDDFMDRRPSSEFLTNYILANPYVKVLNVNSPWGSGKSFFIDRWARALEQEHVCVKFNAWETDYSAEPLVALISCIEEQVVDSLAVGSTVVGKGLINVGSTLVKKAGPLIVKGLVKKISGVELDDLLADGAGNTVDDVVANLLEEQAETKGNVAEFKDAVVARLRTAAENKGLKLPAFIFIDELDRCRPTYAIELLERIKHFFELGDCRFIIASDSMQLAHSIRAVYGQGFASERYLNRFFDAEFNLDNSDVYALVASILPYIESLKLGINVTGRIDDFYGFSGRAEAVYPRPSTITSKIEGFSENAIILVGLVKYFDVALRELVNYVRQIKSVADTLKQKVDFFWLAFLVFFKNSKSECYPQIFSYGTGSNILSKYFVDHPSDVNFSFSFSLESVSSLASFYHSLLIADDGELRRKAEGVDGWKSTIYWNCNSNIERLRRYRGVVDLAHRLS